MAGPHTTPRPFFPLLNLVDWQPLRVRHSTCVPRPPGDGAALSATATAASSLSSLGAAQSTSLQWHGVSASMIQQQAEERLGSLSEDDLSAVVNLTAIRYAVRPGSEAATVATTATQHQDIGGQ